MNTADLQLQIANPLSQPGAMALQRSFAKDGPAEQKKLKAAAQEFEAIFVQQILEAMDKTVDRENSILGGGSAEQYFRGMLNQEVARSISARPGGSGFGLAESIYRQMSRQTEASGGTQASTEKPALQKPEASR